MPEASQSAEATRYAIYGGVRETYDGPLSMATDRMVWNITKEKNTERMAVVTEVAWAVRGIKPPVPAENLIHPLDPEMCADL